MDSKTQGRRINGYGLPVENTKEVTYKVTDWKTALFDTSPLTSEITFNNDEQMHWRTNYKIIGNVFCYLPLTDKWSDLSATFTKSLTMLSA